MVAGKEDTVRSFKRKGYVELPGYSHRRLGYVVNGEIRFRTWVSHGGSDESKIGGSLRADRIRHDCRSQLSDNQISSMAAECHLSRKQFLSFARCEMSAETYRQILIDKGIIPGP
jgi:hypothetical protein